jgi:hypothetical protein
MMASPPAAVILGILGITLDGRKVWAVAATALAVTVLLLLVGLPLVMSLWR